MTFKEWKENRKAKKLAKMDPYVREERRLMELQRTLDPFDEKYDQLQSKLTKLNQDNKMSKETKKRLTPEKATLWAKIIGGLGTIGAIVAVASYEKDGVIATGEKRTIMDSLCSAAGRFMHR